MVSFLTNGPKPVGPVNVVPTALTSTSRRNESSGLASVTPALKKTWRFNAVPPTGIPVLPSLWNWARLVGAFGGTGTDVVKSGGLCGFPSNAVQALVRPVSSAVRACQW